ncbi:hypothetical protein [Lichenihabitans psoromatis]|uniref:hypothetical protein n=1 Tax=Lichenihabitans psoromatis TaxID=2528642 RepID=UPI0010385D2C|nr:hypothetical protein [Lichenihabitans psoromatis]
MPPRISRKRPKPLDEAASLIRDSIRAHIPDAIAELTRLARDANSEAARISAINALIDRAYGGLKDLNDGDDSQHGITVRFVAPPQTT